MIIHFVHQSVDGFIEGPDGEFDWPVMGPEMSAYANALSRDADTFLYGRVVWEMMSSYWPQAEEISDHPHDLEFAPIWREKSKVVVSRTLPDPGGNARVVRDLADLRDIPGTLLLFGGSDLAAGLTEAGLVDEYHIFVHPAVLGGGKPVFKDPSRRVTLDLVESRVLDAQAVLLRYRRR
ncbi:dihydrofolate reductase family protein [Kibdelosporangium persicum]|uniref:Dihydrofolate reductase n=1 Tax=Kibdelosporangium persicum TaxID=2698649 RepID=A0ABX2FDS6_9PSEU|nr:dihydrofolate reductase family protein [Kibdelosporangium persicum]NRN68910.1 Dihydrofolate reductase [Kibdelosporangium persicum]